MFGNDENGHDQITLASFLSLLTRSATSATRMPADALGGFGDVEGGQARRDIDTKVGRLDGVERLLLGFHDVGQRGVARFVEAQIGADDGRQGDGRVSRPPSISRVTVALPSAMTTLEAKVACGQSCRAASIWPVWLASSSMACLPQMTSCGLFFVAECLEQLGDGQRLQFDVGFDEDAAVGTDGHGGAQGFLTGGDTAGDGDDFGRDAGFLEPHGFFHGDFVERVHAHLDVGQIDTRSVRLDANLHVVIHHPLHGNENFHKVLLFNKLFCRFSLYYGSVTV